MARNKRIKFLAELTKGYDHVLDIGTDHGLVLLEAFKKGYIKKAIASDLREEPLNQAKKNLKNYDVDFVLSDGFKQIDQFVDLAIIAGMGSYLITDILSDVSLDITYILQANDKHHILRDFLAKHDFTIEDEFVIHDKFHYVIMIVKKGHMELLEDDLHLGPKLKYKPEAKIYYQHKIKQYEKILIKADDERKKELLKLIKIYKMQ
ncbi:MAG: class I SAM-dependent methyltransferase [Acholeplasmataceae bacterium]